jgi:hypothetical protein
MSFRLEGRDRTETYKTKVERNQDQDAGKTTTEINQLVRVQQNWHKRQ